MTEELHPLQFPQKNVSIYPAQFSLKQILRPYHNCLQRSIIVYNHPVTGRIHKDLEIYPFFDAVIGRKDQYINAQKT